MKFNNAAQNLLLCHLDETPNGSITAQFNRLIITLRSGTMPTDAELKDAFSISDSMIAGVPQASHSTMLNRLGGTTLAQTVVNAPPKFGMLVDRKRRGFNLTLVPEVAVSTAGTISWALMSISNDNTNAHTFYALSVGLKGSGADLELDKTSVVLNDKIKLSTILLDHSFIFGV